jgi:hypothetical protein
MLTAVMVTDREEDKAVPAVLEARRGTRGFGEAQSSGRDDGVTNLERGAVRAMNLVVARGDDGGGQRRQRGRRWPTLCILKEKDELLEMDNSSLPMRGKQLCGVGHNPRE